jgi:hypothetical protein
MSADRSSFEAVNNFADLCAEKGAHLDEAIGRLRTRLDVAGPHRTYGLDTLGCLHYRTGDEEAAANTLESPVGEPAAKDPKRRDLVPQHLAAVNQARNKERNSHRSRPAGWAVLPYTTTIGRKEVNR